MQGGRSSSSRDRLKVADINTAIGYQIDSIPPASSVPLHRYASEVFYDTVTCRPLSKVLSANHIEHGYQTIASVTEKVPELMKIIDHIFLFAFCEILFSGGTERANQFIVRQSDTSSLPPEAIDRLRDLQPEMTDSVPEVFTKLVAHHEFSFSDDFVRQLNSNIDFKAIPAASFLLRPFVHDVPKTNFDLQPFRTYNNRQFDVIPTKLTSPTLFKETLIPRVPSRAHPYAEFKMTQEIPTLLINRPRIAPTQPPNVVAIGVPMGMTHVNIDRSNFGFAYADNTRIMYSSYKEEARHVGSHLAHITAMGISHTSSIIVSADIIGIVKVHSPINKWSFVHSPIITMPTCLAISPSYPSQFAIGSSGGAIFVYEYPHKDAIRLLVGHTSAVTSVAVHPNSEYIASVSMDGYLRVWSITSGQCVRISKLTGGTPTVVKFSRGGKVAAVACSDGTLSMIDIATGRFIRTIKCESGIVSIDFSPNDQTLVCIDKNGGIGFWEPNDNHSGSIGFLRVERGRILTVSFLKEMEVRVVVSEKL